MNSTQQSVRIGMFFLLGVALIWVTFETLSGSKIFRSKGYQLIADFDDVKELKKDDDVRLSGVKIGTVESTNFTGTQAEVVLRIDPGFKVPRDSIASIAMAGLLGNDFVSVKLGSPAGPFFSDGDRISTVTTPDLNAVMIQLGDLGHKLDGALASITTAFNGANGQGGVFQQLNSLVSDNRGKISSAITNLQQISEKINSGQGTMGKLINDSTLHDQLLAAVDEIKGAADQAKTFVGGAQGIVDQIKSGQGPLGTVIYDQRTADNLKATLQNVRDISDKLAKGEGTLGKLINDDGLYNSAQSTLNKADRAIDSLNDSAPITAVGEAANSLF